MAIGAVGNGCLIGKLGLPFLVVTLGTLTLYGGLVDLWSKSFTTQITSPALTALAFNHALGIPIPGWIMLGVFVVALYVQRSTYFGRDVYAVGGSADAARLSGVRVGRTLIAVYAIAGMLAALAGILQDARIGAASPLVGGEVIFDAAAAVLLGGTSFAGGIGGVGGHGDRGRLPGHAATGPVGLRRAGLLAADHHRGDPRRGRAARPGPARGTGQHRAGAAAAGIRLGGRLAPARWCGCRDSGGGRGSCAGRITAQTASRPAGSCM